MPGVLKNLMARIKQRRRSRVWQPYTDKAAHGHASRNDGDDIMDHMAQLSLTPPAQSAAPEIGSGGNGGGGVGSSSSGGGAPAIFHVFGQEGFEFQFSFPRLEMAWPGPKYDAQALFAPGSFDTPRHPKRRPPKKSSKRRVSHDECFIHPKPLDRSTPKPVKSIVPRPKAVPSKPQYHGQPPTREPPVHLLVLPGEIRNQIYRLLCVQDEPIAAQFRQIVIPKQGANQESKVNRRFPREPVMALVCRQLQHETLSIFYGENKFVFRKGESTNSGKTPHFSPPMMRASSIESWRPKFSFANALTSLDVQFQARDPTAFRNILISYTFRKVADGKCSISVDMNGSGCCSCFEDGLRRKAELLWLKDDGRGTELVTLARESVNLRQKEYGKDESLTSDFPHHTWRSVKRVCDQCGRERLTEVVTGL